MKVANPGGAVFWKAGLRGDHRDLDTPLPGLRLTGRAILERLGRAVAALGLPHPLHVHTANLGLPGNWRTLLETMRTSICTSYAPWRYAPLLPRPCPRSLGW